MGWFSRKQPRSADDALVERTLAVAQEVAQEQPDDEQSLLALIDGIKMMPSKPAPAVVADEAPLPGEQEPPPLVPATSLPPVSLSPIWLSPVLLSPVKMSVSSPEPMTAQVAEEPLYPRVSEATVPGPARSDGITSDRIRSDAAAHSGPVTFDSGLSAEVSPASGLPASIPPASDSSLTLSVAIETPPALPLPPPVLRPANPDRMRRSEPRRSSAPPQSEMRREIAQRVQNFKAHQQRLNDEREARIKKIYADMQARLEKSGAPKSPPVS